MKHVKSYESFKLNEMDGLGLLAGAGLLFAAPTMYSAAKQFWSKYFINSKYKETGNTVKILPEIKDLNIFIKEYEDEKGNIFYGYDHPYSPDSERSADMYTALFKASDLQFLKNFLEEVFEDAEYNKHLGGYTTKRSYTQTPNGYEYNWDVRNPAPNPVEMIFRKELS